eukprot:2535224-Heterocapsa_arctica.AAC.1
MKSPEAALARDRDPVPGRRRGLLVVRFQRQDGRRGSLLDPHDAQRLDLVGAPVEAAQRCQGLLDVRGRDGPLDEEARDVVQQVGLAVGRLREPQVGSDFTLDGCDHLTSGPDVLVGLRRLPSAQVVTPGLLHAEGSGDR